MKNNLTKTEIDSYISSHKNSKLSWNRQLWKVVSTKFNKFILTLSNSSFPITISEHELLVHFHVLIYKTIVQSGTIDNAYLDFKIIHGAKKAILKKEIVETLIDDFLFIPISLLGSKKLSEEMKSLIRKANLGGQFWGKKIEKNRLQIYKEIISIRENLIKEGKKGHSISYKKATIIYFNRKHKHPTEKEIRNLAEQVRKFDNR